LYGRWHFSRGKRKLQVHTCMRHRFKISARGRLSACGFVSAWISNRNNIYIHSRIMNSSFPRAELELGWYNVVEKGKINLISAMGLPFIDTRFLSVISLRLVSPTHISRWHMYWLFLELSDTRINVVKHTVSIYLTASFITIYEIS